MSEAFCQKRATHHATWRATRRATAGAAILLASLLAYLVMGPAWPHGSARADRPYAPIRQYALENSRIELRFDVDQGKVIGRVTHTVSALRNGLKELVFDSDGLAISSVEVNGATAHFDTDATGLHVDLDPPAAAGTRFDVSIRYQGTPRKGVYFVLPNASDPTQPREIWTQGEAEDTRYYIPIYDYPNNRETVEMVATVPANWTTISNGKLESVKDDGDGLKTWTWRQSKPISSYLISLVAGEFDTVTETWRNIPIDFHVPRGRRDGIEPTFDHTKDMLSFFSDRLGVPYPWDKYDQTMVDKFFLGGMENVSATTLTDSGLQNPVLAKESLERSDGLISHEMAHQWFGDLVTCTDWADLWLNEGFATFMAELWEEHEYGVDAADYSRWRSQASWFRQARLFGVPIVTGDFHDSLEYYDNTYAKAGMVLEMLREQMGDATFFAGLQHYLEVNRLGNVVTADLLRALDESSHMSLDHFFDQWINGAGAPRFAVSSAYDSAAQQVRLNVRQTQDVRGKVGLFEVPVDVEVATSSGSRDFHITVSKQEETFTFPADSAPRMVLFDKGDKILKTVDFHKEPAEWIYQLQNAADVPDRATAAQQLGAVKGNDAVVAALGAAALQDRFWGVREEALSALGRIGGPDAEKEVLAALANSEPWVRQAATTQLSHFGRDESLVSRLQDLVHDDAAYRVRSAALTSLAQIRASGARQTLEEATNTESPDDIIRRAALRALGTFRDDGALPIVLSWSKQGKPLRLRAAAIGSLGQLDKSDPAVESQLIAYLQDPDYDIRQVALAALADRGDPTAITQIEDMLRKGTPDLGEPDQVQRQLNRLRKSAADSGLGVAP